MASNHEKIFTWCLEIESHHLRATKPEAKRIIVGGVHSLPLWVYPCEALLIVFQEFSRLLLDNAFRLRLNKGANFSEVWIIYRGGGGIH